MYGECEDCGENNCEEQVKLSDKMLKIIMELDLNFWRDWLDQVDDFPDTEDADHVKLLVAESAICTIVINHIMSFKQGKRQYYLDDIIMKLRKFYDQIEDEDWEE
jgi:hypothetical protein